MSGLTPTGFIPKTLEEIRAEINADVLELVDASLDLSSDQPTGQLIGIFAEREAKLWELLAVAYGGSDPRDADDFLLDGVSALTGTSREPARRSTVPATCDVDGGFTAAAGTMFANVEDEPSIVFRNSSDVGPLTAGTHAIPFESLAYGPVVANAGTLTVITSPVSGWNSVTNASDATRGAEQENDASLRLRRENELSAPGACTVDSLRADLLQIEHTDGVRPVQQAYVYENTSLLTDVDGLPGKSFEAVIFDGLSPAATNAEVAAVVWKGKPSGMQSYGTTSQSVLDSTGAPRTVSFSRATIRQVWIVLPDLSVNANEYPGAGDTLVKEAIVAAALRHQNLGIDVVAKRIAAAALTVPGVLDVPTVRLGFAAAPVGTANLVITGREIASLDTGRISVTTATGTP